MSNRINETLVIYNDVMSDSIITDDEKTRLERAGITEELLEKLSGKNQDEASDIINQYFNSEPEMDSTPWYKKAWNTTKKIFGTISGGLVGMAIGSRTNKPSKYAKLFGLLGAVGGLFVSSISLRNNKIEKTTPKTQPETEPQALDEIPENKELKQKNMIKSIIGVEGNCWNKDKNALDKIVDKIIKYVNANNLRAELEEYAVNGKSERVRTLAQRMLDEGFADSFAVFVASIIAKESGFLEKSTKEHEIFGVNGKGILQVTSTLVKDFWDNRIATKCLDPELKGQYKDSQELFNALIDDPEINYQVGIAGLKYKLLYTLDKLEREENWNIPGGENTPTTLLEYTAFMYNGNNKIESKAEQKEDRKFNVRDNYARDIIKTFCKATSGHLNTTKYFECTGYDRIVKCNPTKKGKTGINGHYKLVMPEQN